MKTCLLVTTRHSLFGPPTKKAFERAGLKVIGVDYRDHIFLMPGSIFQRVAKKLPKSVLDRILQYAQKRVDEKILKKAKAIKPDLIFVLKGKDISLDILDQLRAVAPTGNWYSETYDHWETIEKISPHYSYFFSFDPMLAQELNDKKIANARYLPFCADIPKDAEFPKKEFNSDVIFVGSFEPTRYAERLRLLSPIAKFGLKIWGNKAWLATSLAKYYQGHLDPNDMSRTYKESKIVIGMHIFGIAGTGTTNRPFDVTSSGAFLLNHDQRKDIFSLFEDGKEFVSFHDAEDLEQKVKYYLDHPEEREAIARAGFERTRNQHTYEDRIAVIMQQMRIDV